ncbi:MAG: N-acetyl sugar amidotransferase [Alphaproteobacteria bacterium]|nr:N-acetyl sugar amidotransferase [Alphaproteobacteria bacterium]
MTRKTKPIPFEPMTVVSRRSEALASDKRAVRRCKKCLTPETEQTVTFDDDGICNMCQVADERDHAIDWDARRKELDEIIEQHRGKYRFDAIVPFSGGKDSTWVAYVLRKRYDLKLLLVTFDSHFRRPGHLRNVDEVVRKLGCEHVVFRADETVIRKTMLESLKRKGDFCWFCHNGIVTSPFKAALMFKVPLIIWGEPPSEYSGGYYNYKSKSPPDERWLNRQVNLGINAEDMLGFIDGVEMRDMEPFKMPPWEDLKAMNVSSIHLGDYLKWDAPRIYETIHRELGWQMAEVENLHPRYHYEKVECFLQGTRDYLRFIKRGYSRTTQRANLDIRNGELKREEAEQMIAYDAQRPASLDIILNYLGISEEEFMNIARTHQIYPHVHDPETVRRAQNRLPDHALWEERLVPDDDDAD